MRAAYSRGIRLRDGNLVLLRASMRPRHKAAEYRTSSAVSGWPGNERHKAAEYSSGSTPGPIGFNEAAA